MIRRRRASRPGTPASEPELESESEIPTMSHDRIGAGTAAQSDQTEDTMFRSSPMSMVQVYMSKEIGREAVTALGQLGLLHFRDVRVPSDEL